MDLAYLIAHWAQVRAGLVEISATFRDDELTFRPFADSWSVQQLLLHIAHEEQGEFGYGIAKRSTNSRRHIQPKTI
jgi:hypothetical protein